MATHLVAYYRSSYGDVDAEMTAIPDDVLTRTIPTRFSVPADINRVKWMAALGANLTKAQLKAPSLEVRRTQAIITPHVTGGVAFPLAYQALSKPLSPIELVPTEDLAVLVSNGGASASPYYSLVCFGPADLPPVPAGDIRMVRCTGSTTLTANQWTTVQVTPDVALEAGQYTLVGFIPISTSIVAARALIPGQVARPGVIGLAGAEATVKQYANTLFDGLVGYAMGSFTHTTPPQFQFLSSASDTAQVVYMLLVKTA